MTLLEILIRGNCLVLRLKNYLSCSYHPLKGKMCMFILYCGVLAHFLGWQMNQASPTLSAFLCTPVYQRGHVGALRIVCMKWKMCCCDVTLLLPTSSSHNISSRCFSHFWVMENRRAVKIWSCTEPVKNCIFNKGVYLTSLGKEVTLPFLSFIQLNIYICIPLVIFPLPFRLYSLFLFYFSNNLPTFHTL